MHSEKQYIDLYRECREQICAHSAAPLNAVRDAAFEQFERQGFPSRKVERYKYTSVDELFAPDYGVNVNRLEIPVDPYKAFRCDVPNLSTSLYFIVNDQFRAALQPKENLPEGVVVDSLAAYAQANPQFVADHYAQLAHADEDGITALNTMLGGPLVSVASVWGVSPALLILPLVICASCCFLLPLDTVPLLTYSTGYYKMMDMPKVSAFIQVVILTCMAIWVPIALRLFGFM